MAVNASDMTVVGAGLAGLASAWALQERGWQVRVLEAREGPALETSYANAGMLTPSMADPWNAPGVWKQLLAWLGREQAPMLLRPAALPMYLGWGLRFLANSRPARHRAATEANFALAALSMEEFRRLRETLRLDYDLRTRGTMQVFRQRADFEAARRHAGFLERFGLRARVLEPRQMVDTETLLEPVAGDFVGAVHFPDDETGDAHRFCQGLARALEQRGAVIEYGVRLESLRVERGRLRGLGTSAGERDCRHAVLATAARTTALLRRAGLPLPVRPVKGYSLTVPVRDRDVLPSLSIIDHHHHSALTPFEDRIRVAGTAEFAGWDETLRPGRIDMLWQLLDALLPGRREHLDRDAATSWCGFRPMAADCVAYVGPTPIDGLAVNTGHGHLGWTQSMGSGRLLAELLGGQAPSIDPAPYAFDRG